MTAPAAVGRRRRPIPAWQPPIDADALRATLEKCQRWDPYDGDALLDDVGAVLDDVTPREEDLQVLAQRLRRRLTQLVGIAVATEADQKDPEAGRLTQQARTVHTEDMPGDHMKAVGRLRRMAWSVNELLERLSTLKHLKEAA
ncbi:DUF6415 family natural product biosynthesis protein [Streptomyces sp. NPDC051907]|uniref:DUF6415 family natural product biosynthesis protein n=1 Tax=Streptomyces sp. NPDC051907 TaxID=3155284 RepID=UPI00341257C4